MIDDVTAKTRRAFWPTKQLARLRRFFARSPGSSVTR